MRMKTETCMAESTLAELADRGSKLTIDSPEAEKLACIRLMRDAGSVPKEATFYFIGHLMIRFSAPRVMALADGVDGDSEIMLILADTCQQHGEVEMAETCLKEPEKFWESMRAGEQWWLRSAREHSCDERGRTV